MMELKSSEQFHYIIYYIYKVLLKTSDTLALKKEAKCIWTFTILTEITFHKMMKGGLIHVGTK